ncbi:membrane protein [Pseudorhizobium pelagicum]|uniref:Membrane protein n=2 Tax=Pseudorhizobium pelagicum TaxID=1509405 RepID=A0A922NXY6_9HYPH|nr:membrane protein [Pseudorhizobium pelagicum]KEQ02392.1 membrane protein [Pseudorhizobium pelagicum]
MTNNRLREMPAALVLQHFVTCLSILATLFILVWVLGYSSYGLDFTDESFYLVWMADPFLYEVSATQFGFVYHPLSVLLKGDISALRQANILITFGLAWAMTCLLLHSLAPEARERRVVLHAVAAGLATSALIFFDSWLPTPGYDSLALQSLLITGIGLLLAETKLTPRSLSGWIVIGIGGWLAFMAKPSTALALAFGVCFCLLVSRKFSLQPLLLAAAVAIVLLLISALLIDGSVEGFVERVRLAIEFAKYIGGGHTAAEILRIDNFLLPARTKHAILFVLVATLVAIWGALSKKALGLIATLVASIGYFAITAVLALGEITGTAGLGQFQGLLISGVAFSAALSGVLFARMKLFDNTSAAQWGLGILFLFMPHIYAFGTNGNYWESGSSAGIFWLLAGVTVIAPIARDRKAWTFAIPFALATQAIAATLLQTGFEEPQRQPQPLRLNDTNVAIGISRSNLTLPNTYATYISGAMTAAQDSGFRLGDPAIDLSGQSPGILYAIGAANIGQAWTIGGYPGSLKLAQAALELVSCEKIAAAWVLYEPDGPRSIPVELMHWLGAAFPGNYEQVSTWRTAEGAGGYAESRIQQLWKPAAAQDTQRGCRALREKETK